MSVGTLLSFLEEFLAPVSMGDAQLNFVARVVLALIAVERASFNALARAMRPANMTNATMLADLHRTVQALPGALDWSSAFVGSLLKSGHNRIVVATDWTSMGQFSFLVTALICRSRAIPLLYTAADQFGDMVEIESQHFRLLRELMGSTNCIVLADRGFGNVRIARALQASGLGYVLRTKESARVGLAGSDVSTFKRLGKIRRLSGKVDDFGEVDFTLHSAMRVRIVRSADSGHKQPWLLMTNLDCPAHIVVRLYSFRFRIEAMFRDLKNARYGFGLESYYFRRRQSVENVFSLICTAYWVCYLAGLHVRRRDWQKHYQSGSRYELACWRLGVQVLADEVRSQLLTADQLRCQGASVALKVGQWDWSPRPHEVNHTWSSDSSEQTSSTVATNMPKATEQLAIVKNGQRPTEKSEDFALRQRVRELMEDADMNKRVLSKKIGRVQRRVTSFLNGRMRAPGTWIAPLSKALDVTAEQLLEGTGWTARKRGRPFGAKGKKPPKTGPRAGGRECDRLLCIRIQEEMVKLNLNRSGLAALIRRTPSNVSAILKGRLHIPASWIAILAAALQVTETQLLSGTGWTPKRYQNRTPMALPVIEQSGT